LHLTLEAHRELVKRS